MKSRLFFSCLLILVVLISSGCLAQADTVSTFKKLSRLKGKWQGTFEWSGNRSGQGEITATYYLTGNGSAVVEDLAYGADPIMTSVYHMDGDTIRMTHFCAAGNQPRLKATLLEKDEQVLQFEMVDITNMPSPDGPHVHAVKLSLESDNKIELAFTFVQNGKESVEQIHLTRVKD